MRKISPSMVGVGALAACFLLALVEPRFLAALSRIGTDVLRCSMAVPPQSGRIVIVDIDEASLKAQGQWPWPRRTLGRLTRQLAELGASVVAFDIVFPEIDRTSPEKILEGWRRDYGEQVRIEGLPGNRRDDDEAFAAAMSLVPCVLGCSMELGGAVNVPADTSVPYRGRYVETGQPQHDILPQASGIVSSLQVLKTAASSTAFFNTTVDDDNVVRSTPLLFALGPDRIYPSLSLETLRLLLGMDNVQIHYDPGGRLGVQEVRLRDLAIPTDAHGRLALNFRNATYPRVSAEAVLLGRVDPLRFKDAIVLVGTSAAGMRDLSATPLEPEAPGVDIHATAIDNMLAGDMLKAPRWMEVAQLAVLLLLCGLLIPLINRVRAWVGLFLVSGAVLLSFGLAYRFLRDEQLLFSPVEIAITSVVIYTLMTAVKYWNEELERRRVRMMFGTMVSSQVLDYIEAHPGSFALAGRKVEATILFSDITNFSQMAESLAPDVLSQLLNRYLTPMTNLVMARGGYVDKFNGDAMMAVWGIPYPTPDHAAQACLSALEQLERLDQMRAELTGRFGFEVFIRIGMNTGTVTAGNMGSERRFQYTVLGDPVNQAFRFEAIAKYYGVSTVMGEETFIKAREVVEARRLDVVTIKGKTQPVTMYELMARKGALDEARRRMVSQYEQALEEYRKRDFGSAASKFEQALQICPTDKPSALLLERTRQFMKTPPGVDWRGVTRMDFLGDPAMANPGSG
ncbi:MAG: adenylate/guanylate cyclase domain-containing protein [Lentisphaerota bacterium]